MGRFRPHVLLLFGTIITIVGVAARAAARLAGPPQSSSVGRAAPPQSVADTAHPNPLSGAADPAIASAIPGAVAPTPADVHSRATERSRFRPGAFLLVGITCVMLGVALYAGTKLAGPPQSAVDPTPASVASGAADPTLASAASGAVVPTRPDATSPATDAAGMAPAAPPAVTLTTIIPVAPESRLPQIAATVGFTVLGLKAPGWKLAAVDTQTQSGESFAAVSYTRGSNYVTITQEKMGTPPTLPGAQPTTIRGQAGTLALMNPVVLLRWQEQGVAILLTTNLPRDAALSLTERLEPVP